MSKICRDTSRSEALTHHLVKKGTVINTAGWVWLFLGSTIQLHTCHFTVLLQRYDSVLCQKLDLNNIILLMWLFAWNIPLSSNVKMITCTNMKEVFKEATLEFFSLLVFCFNIFTSPFLVLVYIRFSPDSLSILLILGLYRESQYFMLKLFLYLPAE